MGIELEDRRPHSPEAPTGPRSGNAIVGIAVSAVVWVMLACLLLVVFWG